MGGCARSTSVALTPCSPSCVRHGKAEQERGRCVECGVRCVVWCGVVKCVVWWGVRCEMWCGG